MQLVNEDARVPPVGPADSQDDGVPAQVIGEGSILSVEMRDVNASGVVVVSADRIEEGARVVVRAADIEADLESVWARLRARFGAGEMPRVLNLVTGPSRSGDIEQTMLLGAHGPRRLHIVIVRD